MQLRHRKCHEKSNFILFCFGLFCFVVPILLLIAYKAIAHLSISSCVYPSFSSLFLAYNFQFNFSTLNIKSVAYPVNQ